MYTENSCRSDKVQCNDAVLHHQSLDKRHCKIWNGKGVISSTLNFHLILCYIVKCQYISWQESLHGRENKEVWKWSESPWHKILARIQPMQFTLCIYISFLRYKFQNLKTNFKISNSTLCPLCNNLCKMLEMILEGR